MRDSETVAVRVSGGVLESVGDSVAKSETDIENVADGVGGGVTVIVIVSSPDGDSEIVRCEDAETLVDRSSETEPLKVTEDDSVAASECEIVSVPSSVIV